MSINEHWTQKHGRHVPKKQFTSLEECIEFLRENKIRGYHPYVCSVCGQWHIGHDK